MKERSSIAYLFTTFPAKSETFLQREIEALQNLPVDLTLFSLWHGGKCFNGLEINKFPKYKLILLPLIVFIEFIRSPKKLVKGLIAIFTKRPHNLINLAENFMGTAFAFAYLSYFRKSRFDLIHATWATMPATAALILFKLTDIPFSMGAHAYDIFKDSGDTFLKNKIKHSKFIHTSSENAKNHLLKFCPMEQKVILIRRGLTEMPTLKSARANRSPLNILSIGRLVEKKGFFRQLNIYKFLQEQSFSFKAIIIGEGPLEKKLQIEINKHNLEEHVQIIPWILYSKLDHYHQWADVFLFTGQVARNGDRDGLPNVIPEVMAKGIPVVTSAVSAIPEVIKNNKNGFIIEDYDNDRAWLEALDRLAQDDQCYLKMVGEARQWVEAHYDAHKNANLLLSHFKQASN